MTHAMRRSAACRGKPVAAETIHRAHLPSALRKSARALEAIVAMRNRAGALETAVAMRNRACAPETAVAMRNRAPLALSNCALAMNNCALAVSNYALAASVLRTGFVRILRCFVRSMGVAHELAQIETSIVGNLSKTLTRSEPCHDSPKAVTRGLGQQVGLFQGAETEPRFCPLPRKSMDRDSGLIRDLRQHTMVALRRCDVLSVTLLIMDPLAAVSLITGPFVASLLTMAPVTTVLLITDLLITAMLVAGLLTMAPVITVSLITDLLVPVLLIAGLLTMAPVIAVPLITGLLVTTLLVPVLLIAGLLITAMLSSVV